MVENPLSQSEISEKLIGVNDAIRAWGKSSFRIEHENRIYDFSYADLDPMRTESDYGVVIYSQGSSCWFEGGIRIIDSRRIGMCRNPEWAQDSLGGVEIPVDEDGNEIEEEGMRKVCSNPMIVVREDTFAGWAQNLMEILISFHGMPERPPLFLL